MISRAQLSWVILPILPLILGFGVLHILNDGTITLLSDAVPPEGYFATDVGLLFYNLPSAVVQDSAPRDLISDFAQGMAMFWGITFTLTLLAVFGPAHLPISRTMAAQKAADTALQERVAGWSLSKQATRILTTMAPLLVGSSAMVVDLMAGAFTG